MVRFGVWDHMPLLDGQTPAELHAEHLDLMVEADELGFDQYWLAEHHFSPHYSCLPTPHMVLAAAAMRTTRLRLGVLINVLPFHDPIRLVEEINTLDQLSGGRAMLGLGRGMRAYEYERLGIAMADSTERFYEGLAAVCSLLDTSRPTTMAGRWFACDDVVIAPESVQRPHVEVVLASSTNPRSAEAAARHGMRLVQGLGSDADLTTALDSYRAASADLDGGAHDPRLTIMRMTCVRDDGDEARAIARTSMGALLRSFSGDDDERYATDDDESFRHHTNLAFGGRLGPLSFDELADSGFVLVGDPDEVAAGICSLVDRFGADTVLASFTFAGLPATELGTSMRCYANEVVPRVRAALVT